MAKIHLCGLEDIADGEARGFDPLRRGHDQLFIIRRGKNFVAWCNACPHPGYEGTSLPWRRNAYLTSDGSRIMCSGHGAQFDIETGDCLLGPCLGQALQPAAVQLESNGQLYWYTNNLKEK